MCLASLSVLRFMETCVQSSASSSRAAALGQGGSDWELTELASQGGHGQKQPTAFTWDRSLLTPSPPAWP